MNKPQPLTAEHVSADGMLPANQVSLVPKFPEAAVMYVTLLKLRTCVLLIIPHVNGPEIDEPNVKLAPALLAAGKAVNVRIMVLEPVNDPPGKNVSCVPVRQKIDFPLVLS